MPKLHAPQLHRRRSSVKYRRRRPPPGAAPGTLVFDAEAAPPIIRAMAYGPDAVVEEEVTDLARLKELDEQWPVLWIDVEGLGHEAVLRQIGDLFGVHRLVMEDAVNLGQRAKTELYEGQIFVVGRMPIGDTHETEQVSLLLRPGVVISMQEKAGDSFEPVRGRIRHGQGRIRYLGADYLAYALLDAVIDQYFPVLEKLGEALDRLEDEVFNDPGKATLQHIHSLKRDLVSLRKAIWPHREMVNSLQRDAGELVGQETQTYLRDAYDHVVRLIDLTEAQREVASDLMGSYLSTISNRMNEVMKVLTIIATIFIPLSFVAGLYGMNFDPGASRWNMPELGWAYGYPAVLLVMAAIGGGMLLFMRRRGWL